MKDKQDPDSPSVLHLCAQWGHDVLVNSLLTNGADANAKGRDGITPIMMAAKNHPIANNFKQRNIYYPQKK